MKWGSLGGGGGGSYEDIVSQNAKQYDQVLAGYSNLMAGIGNVYDSEGIALQDQYVKMQGLGTQSLISRGLGNTTVQESVNRGLGLDFAKAKVDLAGKKAGLSAGYQADMLRFLGSQIRDPYPYYALEQQLEQQQFQGGGGVLRTYGSVGGTSNPGNVGSVGCSRSGGGSGGGSGGVPAGMYDPRGAARIPVPGSGGEKPVPKQYGTMGYGTTVVGGGQSYGGGWSDTGYDYGDSYGGGYYDDGSSGWSSGGSSDSGYYDDGDWDWDY